MEKKRTYIAIDLKSFYASVECKERYRDPLTTNLVVADKSRTEKTICLAVSPALKCYGDVYKRQHLSRLGVPVGGSHYNKVYSGTLKSGENLDSIYERFNLYHPDAVSYTHLFNRGLGGVATK